MSNARASGRFDALEGWRAIAALMVLFYHCGVNLRTPPFAMLGFCGVHLFFVLSGYLLFRPYAAAMMQGRAAPSTANFYLRRFLRIMPPYLVSLAVFTLLRVVTRVNVPSVFNVAMHGLLIFNFIPRIDFFSINPVLWSLAIEAQFYLLLPMVCLLAMRLCRGRRGGAALAAAVGAMAVAGVAARCVEVHWLGKFYAGLGNTDHVRFRSTFAYLDLFAFGMAVAAIQSAGPAVGRMWEGPWRRGLIAVLGLGLFFAANDWCIHATGGTWQSPGPQAFVILFPVLVCAGLGILLLLIVTHPSGGPAWMRLRGLRWTGEISYSLYLYHVGVLFFVFRLRLFHRWSYAHMTLGNALVALGPSLAIAAVFFYLVERPSLMLVARVRDAQKPAPAATDPAAAAGDPAAPALQPVSLLAP